MDKEIPVEQIRKRRLRRIVTVVLPFVLIIVAAVIVISLSGATVRRSGLIIAKAELGNVENSVVSSGKVVPAFEQVMVSPVATRIMEIYCQEGAEVDSGQPIMRLDLHAAETEVRKLSDELSMKHYSTRRGELDSKTFLTNLEMNIKAKEMSVDELKAQVANERRLDSIGSGTGEQVRQTELAYRTALIELEQMRKQLVNERLAHSAANASNRLEEGIYEKNLSEANRRLEDARVKAPRKATLTFLNNSIGASVGAGEKLAVLSDLGHFKINAEIPEGNVDKLSPGADVDVRLGSSRIKGRVGNILPQATNGMISFTVILEDDADSRLRSGMRVDLNVVCGLKEKVVRIPNGAYFHGAGVYTLFVIDESGDHAEARKIELGDSNFDFVEVKSGLRAGERVITSDMSQFEGKESLKLSGS